jgi:hypothetical protein
MTPLSVIALLVVAAGAVAFVAAPLLRSPAGTAAASADGGLEVLERKHRALAALRELEFDHRTGKVADADYAVMLPALRREAAEALQAAAAEPPA